jgi:hypothetical protein
LLREPGVEIPALDSRTTQHATDAEHPGRPAPRIADGGRREDGAYYSIHPSLSWIVRRP